MLNTVGEEGVSRPVVKERPLKPDSTDVRMRVVQAEETRDGARRQGATTGRVRVSGVRRRRHHDRATGRVVPTPLGEALRPT